MTIGVLARLTGASGQDLAQVRGHGSDLHGHSPGNYRLVDDDALWWVGAVTTMCCLGLTFAEIQDSDAAPVAGAIGDRWRRLVAQGYGRLDVTAARLGLTNAPVPVGANSPETVRRRTRASWQARSDDQAHGSPRRRHSRCVHRWQGLRCRPSATPVNGQFGAARFPAGRWLSLCFRRGP